MTQPRTEEEIRTWIVDKLSKHMNLKPERLNLDEPIDQEGVDSVQLVGLIGELEDWLGCRFADNPLIDYPSINALSAYLARQVQAGKTVIDPTQD